jgi:hypothetical protein
VELADLDGDGYVDIVFSNYWNGFSTSINSYVYWGSASGYSTGDRTSLPTVGAAGVSVGFMNSDGWLDIVFSNYSNGSGDFTIDSYLYWGSSSGFSSGNKRNFATWGSHRSYVGEITGDCCWDLIFTNHRNDTGNNAMDSFVYHGAGGGPYEANLSTVDTLGASGVDAADVNGDGWYDLAITNYSDAGNFDLDSYIYWGVGPSTWWSSANRSAFPTIGGAQVSFHHIDGDGQIDMLVANHGDGVDYTQNSHLYWGTGGAPSTGQRVSMATVGAWGHAAGDFDEDGDVDIVFANNVDNSGNFQINSYIYWNVGAPTWFTSANRTSLYTRGAKNVAASGPAVEILRSN